MFLIIQLYYSSFESFRATTWKRTCWLQVALRASELAVIAGTLAVTEKELQLIKEQGQAVQAALDACQAEVGLLKDLSFSRLFCASIKALSCGQNAPGRRS